MSKKRGATQVDWVISLAIFLLYLAWFFIYLSPITKPGAPDEFLEPLRSAVLDRTTWTIEQYPLFFYSGFEADDYAVLVDFPFSWERGSFGLERYYVVDDDRLIFLANVKPAMNRFILSKSDQGYSVPEIGTDIIASNYSVSSSRLKADLNDVFLENIELENASKIENINLFLNDKNFISLNYSINTSRSSIHYKHKIRTEFINLSTYIFSKNSRIVNFISPNYKSNLSRYTLTFKADIIGYNNYFSNNDNFGELRYEDPGNFCPKINASFIDFYNRNSSGLAISLSNNSNIGFCYDTDDSGRRVVDLTIELPLSEDSFLNIDFHKKQNLSIISNSSEAYKNVRSGIIGAKEIKKGLSESRIKELFKKDYPSLKNELRIPQSRDFTIKIVNSTINATDQETFFSFDIVSPTSNSNVYVKKYNCNLLSRYGNQKSCYLIIKSW